MEATASKINQIIENAMANVPPGVFAINKMMKMQAIYEENGEVLSFNLNEMESIL